MRYRQWLLAASVIGVLWGTPAAASTEFRIATIAPAGTAYVQGLRAAGEEIAARTDGRVTLRFYPGGVMGSDQAVLRRMRVGQLHGAVVPAGGVAGIHPDAQIYSLPFLFRSYDEVAHVRRHLDPVIRERVESRDYILAGIGEGGFTYLFSRDPIRNLDDLRQARVWTPAGDDISPRMFARADIPTVSLPVADVYTGLQTRLVDSAAINPAGAIALQWHTSVRYQLDAPLTFLVAMLVLDRRSVERLSADDQAILRQVFSETFRQLDRRVREENAEAMQVLRDRGIELLEPSHPPAERGWDRIARETLTAMEAEGRFDGRLLAELRELLAQFRAEHDD